MKQDKIYKKLAVFNPVPKPSKASTRQQINRNNRNFGRAVEVRVAQLTGGHRVPMSGAIKNSIWRLEGDVRVNYTDSQEVLALIECKGTARINSAGEKMFTLKRKVLEQADEEAKISNAIPAVWVHWKGADYLNDDIVIIPEREINRVMVHMTLNPDPEVIHPTGNKTYSLHKSAVDAILRSESSTDYARLVWEGRAYLVITSQTFIDIITKEQENNAR